MNGAKFLYLVLGLMGMAFGIWFFIQGMKDLSEAWESASWPKAPGKIQDSFVGSSYSHSARRGGYSYWPEITYTYTESGVTYTGKVVEPGHYTWGLSSSNKVVEAYPTGMILSIPHSPTDPSQAVLMPGLHAGNFIKVLVALFALSFALPLTVGGLFAIPDPDGKAGSMTLPDGPFFGPLIPLSVLAFFVEFGLLWWLI